MGGKVKAASAPHPKSAIVQFPSGYSMIWTADPEPNPRLWFSFYPFLILCLPHSLFFSNNNFFIWISVIT